MNNDNPAKQLIGAITVNDVATASSLISSGDVNLNDKPWPLHMAVELGRLEIMTLLLDAGADIDLCEDGWRTNPCERATYYNQFDAFKLLVERGANLNGRASEKSLLAYVAYHCYYRSDQFIMVLLDAGAPLDNLTWTELMLLVRSAAIFKCLLIRGVNFNAKRDKYGGNLYHHVAKNITDEKDLRSVVDVCGTRALDAVNDDGKTPFHSAVSAHNIAAMRVLVELGANIDHQDNQGRTPLALHIAARSHDFSVSCFNLLLALGADIHLVDIHDQTTFSACSLALNVENRCAFVLLIAAGGGVDDLYLRNDKGEALYMIARLNDVELPSDNEIDDACQRIAKTRLDLVRHRATEICIGLQQLDLNALQLCEIMMHSFGALGSLIAFHQWWAIATKVKHFNKKKE